MNKYIFLFGLSLLHFVLFAQKKSCAVSLVGASSQRWIAGAGGRTGTSYRIKLLLKTDKQIDFSGLWIGDKNAPITLEYDSYTPPTTTKKNDIVYVTTNIVNNVDELDFTPAKTPFKYNGLALLQIKVGGKIEYVYIKAFKPLKSLAGE